MKKKDLIKTIITDNQLKVITPVWERRLKIPLNSNKIITLAGVRRSGKTYLLYSLMNQLEKQGVSRQQIIHINFEDERLELTIKDLDLILQAYQELYPEQNLADCCFFFDEIQEVEGWEKFVNRVYSKVSKNIFVTGSNAKLLSQEIASVLRGRGITFEVFPLSFQEYVSILEPQINRHSSQGKAKLNNLFTKFMHEGGFPELVTSPDEIKNKILQEYFNVMLMRDLIERYQISQTGILKYFCKRVIGNSAQEFSVNKIYRELKSQNYQVGKNTLYDYRNYAETIYLTRLIPKFSHSIVKKEMSQKKSYVIDQGLGAALDYKLSQDKGRLLETTVALELIKHEKNISFDGNGYECDFVVTENEQPAQAIQVTMDLSDFKTKEREIKGLVKTCQGLGLKQGTVVSYDQSDEIVQDGITIEVKPAVQFALEM